jgi:hypothetical protein
MREQNAFGIHDFDIQPFDINANLPEAERQLTKALVERAQIDRVMEENDIHIESLREIMKAALLYAKGDERSVVDMLKAKRLHGLSKDNGYLELLQVLLKGYTFTEGQIKYILECIDEEDDDTCSAAYCTLDCVSDFGHTFMLVLDRCKSDFTPHLESLTSMEELIRKHPEQKKIIKKHLKTIEKNCFPVGEEDEFLIQTSARIFEALKAMFPEKAKKYGDIIDILLAVKAKEDRADHFESPGH